MSLAPDPSAQPLAADARRAAIRWVILTIIFVHACMAVTRITASLWVLRGGYGESAVGLMLSLFAVGPIFLSLWAGRLADRYGLHRPLGISVLLATAGALAVLVHEQVWTLAVSCLLSGGAIGMAIVAIQREAGQMASEPAELKQIFSWLALGPALSNAIAPVITGFLIDGWGVKAAFLLAALLPPVAWLVALGVPRVAPAPPPAGSRERAAWDLLKLPMLRRILVVNLALAACWDAHIFVVPVVGHARGLSASSIGLVLGSFATAATLIRLVIVRYGDRIDEVRALRGAMLLAAGVLLAYAWLPGTLGLMVGSGLLGMALGSVQPMVLSMMHHATPPDRQGQALGLRMLVINSATVSMPTGFGLLAAATAPAAPLWLMAGCLTAAQWPARKLQGAGARDPSNGDSSLL